MKFIAAIKEKIVANVPPPFEREDVLASIDRWERGEEPQCILDHGVFEMCRTVEAAILESDEEEGP